MPDRRRVALLGLLLVLPALAGCASQETPGGRTEPIQPGSTQKAPIVDPTPATVETPKPKGTSERWHFHDYWKGSPTITLFEGVVTLEPTVSQDGLPALGKLLDLPPGIIVPAETGFLLVNVTWEGAAPGGAINVTYKPADANGFFAAGNATNGVPARLNTTESMCDVPHRQLSLWKFNLSAAPEGTPPMLPPREVHVNITATIGRRLFIDPPHVDWWTLGEVFPIIVGAQGEVATAITPAANVTLVGAPPALEPKPAQVVVPVDEGKIVPEGAVTVVAMVNWTTQAPGQKLTLRYKESNLPSEGMMEIAKDTATSRIYTLQVRPPMTDTTYSNRTTWEFHVLPEGQPQAFHGSFTLVAWVSELSVADTLARIGAS